VLVANAAQLGPVDTGEGGGTVGGAVGVRAVLTPGVSAAPPLLHQLAALGAVVPGAVPPPPRYCVLS